MPIYILEAEIVLGVLYRKGVIPKKGGTLDFRDLNSRDRGESWGGVPPTHDPKLVILLQKHRDTNGRRTAIQIGGVYTLICQQEGILIWVCYSPGLF